MPHILHQFPISAPPDAVFEAISSATGLNAWWAKETLANPVEGGIYQLNFGPQYNWQATATRYRPNHEFELTLTEAMPDWLGTRVRFLLYEKEGLTEVQFSHKGWPEESDHFRISSFCWAMYLRLLKRYIETGQVVEYEKRLEA